VIMLGLLAFPPVFANKAMLIQATLNPTPSQQGLSVVIAGKVLDASGTAVPNAIVSIQVTNPGNKHPPCSRLLHNRRNLPRQFRDTLDLHRR